MSQIRYIGTPSTRVHRGDSRTAMKKARWGHVPKQKQRGMVWDTEAKLLVLDSVVTLAAILIFFFTWLYSG